MYKAITIPELNTTRRVWVYLPRDYIYSGKNYTVLYMQDGQNLFDTTTSFSGEWEVDEYLDSIDFAGIVIGIDNGGENRVNEYNPNDDPRNGKGMGMEYLARIVSDLKPLYRQPFPNASGKGKYLRLQVAQWEG
jgi:predicted alpha/beta superfamily hydrolase